MLFEVKEKHNLLTVQNVNSQLHICYQQSIFLKLLYIIIIVMYAKVHFPFYFYVHNVSIMFGTQSSGGDIIANYIDLTLSDLYFHQFSVRLLVVIVVDKYS